MPPLKLKAVLPPKPEWDSATDQEGFTLLEVIVALGILTLGIASALGLFAAATAAQKRAIDQVNSAVIAEQAFADFESALSRGVEIDTLVKSPPFTSVEASYPGYTVRIVELRASEEQEAFWLAIEVFWKFKGRESSERFEQYFVPRRLRP